MAPCAARAMGAVGAVVEGERLGSSAKANSFSHRLLWPPTPCGTSSGISGGRDHVFPARCRRPNVNNRAGPSPVGLRHTRGPSTGGSVAGTTTVVCRAAAKAPPACRGKWPVQPNQPPATPFGPAACSTDGSCAYLRLPATARQRSTKTKNRAGPPVEQSFRATSGQK